MSVAEARARHEALGAAEGFHRALGTEHSALFVRGGSTLLVTFENLDQVSANSEDRLPWGHGFATAQGWSLLGLMAHGWTWYRDEAVFDFFDEMRDTGFLDSFDRVIFYGASMGAYAAAAFAAAAPGSVVIAISPQATLSREIAGWETRYRKAWRRDFSATSRYAYAPDGASSSSRTYLFYDPTAPLDAMHASLFRGPNVAHHRCRFMGHRIASLWQSMGVLKAIVVGSAEGRLTAPEFYRLLRARRGNPRYERELLDILKARDRPGLTARLCRSVLARRGGPRFRQALRVAERQLADPV